MRQACAAATKEGARCRNFVDGHGELCPAHRGATLAERPDTILVKFRANPTWAARFRGIRVPDKAAHYQAREPEHASQARRHGRQPYRLRRDIADSGVPVFGQDGLRHVSISNLVLEELIGRQGYRVVDVHLLPSRREGDLMKLLVLVLAQEGRQVDIPIFKFLGLFEEMQGLTSWGHCHVWANLPKDGNVVHTVNLSHRQENASPELVLSFANGLWDALPD